MLTGCSVCDVGLGSCCAYLSYQKWPLLWTSVVMCCFPLLLVAFWGIVLILVLLWPVERESHGFDSGLYIVLVWFASIWLCSLIGFGGV